jgi:hypothetical protein
MSDDYELLTASALRQLVREEIAALQGVLRRIIREEVRAALQPVPLGMQRDPQPRSLDEVFEILQKREAERAKRNAPIREDEQPVGTFGAFGKFEYATHTGCLKRHDPNQDGA